MRTVCETDLCNGCAACASICAKNAIQLVDSIEYFNAVIDDSRCVNCGACSNVCPRISQRYVFRKPTEWLQGWTKDDATRGASASGGAASELMKSFIANNGYVCSCAFREGEFSYFITNKVEEIKLFAGSKYVKSNPQFVYREVKKLINAGNSVLFIGLPCHVAAMKNYIGRSKNQDLLYTADLICHGSPSVKVLKKYLADYGHDLEKLEDIKFREKSDFRLGSNYKPIVKPGIADWYLYTFLKKISCSKNCYHCQYARTERISDVTLGDSWGSLLPKQERKNGISLILVQTPKGREIVERASLILEPADPDLAVKSNKQLKAPANEPEERSLFMKLFEKNRSYKYIVFRIAPFVFIRRNIKLIIYALLNKEREAKSIAYAIAIKKKTDCPDRRAA